MDKTYQPDSFAITWFNNGGPVTTGAMGWDECWRTCQQLAKVGYRFTIEDVRERSGLRKR